MAAAMLLISQSAGVLANHMGHNHGCTIRMGRSSPDSEDGECFPSVDLHPSVAAMLRDFIGDRKQGFIFQTRTGTPFLQPNFLRSSQYPILKELGIEKQGFHGFRRFRVTHLESSYEPPALVKYLDGPRQIE
jgi:hypothetical protein